MKIYGKFSHLYLFSKWEKLIWDFFHGKLYHSCNRTFSLGNGEIFIDETGQNLFGFQARLVLM